MISFFRRALSSWLALGLFALVLVAFIITGVNGPTMGGGGGVGRGATIAKAGDVKVTADELARQVRRLHVEQPGDGEAQQHLDGR